jgi:hypothetical protein
MTTILRWFRRSLRTKRVRRGRQFHARVAQAAGQVASEKSLASHRVGQRAALHAALRCPHERVHNFGSASTLLPDVEAKVAFAPGTVDIGYDGVEDGLKVVEQLDVVAGQDRKSEDVLGMALDRLRRRPDLRGCRVVLMPQSGLPFLHVADARGNAGGPLSAKAPFAKEQVRNSADEGRAGDQRQPCQ